MKQPKITIITVTYNAQLYLEKTIKSVINQDYTNIEYIIIDGNSSDNTVEIIKKYEQYLSYWINQPDSGIYDAMNKAIRKASGEWINFLNAGDTYIDNKILNKIFTDNNFSEVDAVYGGVNLVNDNYLVKEYFKPNDLNSFLINYSCNHQTFFLKTSIHKENEFNLTYKTSADVDLILKLYKKNYTFKMFDFPIVNYLEGGFSEENQTLQLIELLHIFYLYKSESNSIFDSFPFKFLIDKATKENPFLFYDLEKDFISKLFKLFADKKIVLYGYGILGKLIYQNLKENIFIIVDQNYKELNKIPNYPKIYSPKILKKLKLKNIFISIKGREKEIEEYIRTCLQINDIKYLDIKDQK